MNGRPPGGWPTGTPSQCAYPDDGPYEDWPDDEYVDLAERVAPSECQNIHYRHQLATAIQDAVECFKFDDPEES